MSVTETLLLEPTTESMAINTFRFPTTTTTEYDDDEGLVMLLDSKAENKNVMMHLGSPILRSPVPQLCGLRTGDKTSMSLLTISTSSLLHSTQEYYIKSLHKLNAAVQRQATKIFQFFLYVSLFVLLTQAVTIIGIFFIAPVRTWGVWFLVGCGSILSFLFIFTSDSSHALEATPPPTPSHSSHSLNSSS